MLLLGITGAALGFVLWYYSSGERVTREPLEDLVMPQEVWDDEEGER